tara:strand:+ start:513 stop:1049 length:537 start_codon:yes stop_codon:yes gene_type:complete
MSVLCAILGLIMAVSTPQKAPFLLKKAFFEAQKHSKYVQNTEYIAIVDYDLPITRERFYIYHTKTGRLVLKSRVSHAKKSGNLYARRFSNRKNSFKSSKGSFITYKTYKRNNKKTAMRLIGLEKGNNNALRRGIVIHNRNGNLHSGGCFTFLTADLKKVLSLLKGGAFFYVYKTPIKR